MLWRLFTPLLVNFASSVHNTWYKMSCLSTVLCRCHWQNYKWRLLSPGCCSYISCTWKGYNICSLSRVHQAALWERPVSCATWQALVSGLACIGSHISSSFCTLYLLQPLCWWHECAYFPQTVVYHCKRTSVGLPPIWIPTLVFIQFNSRFPPQNRTLNLYWRTLHW
jgi:hypothetical protein